MLICLLSLSDMYWKEYDCCNQKLPRVAFVYIITLSSLHVLSPMRYANPIPSSMINLRLVIGRLFRLLTSPALNNIGLLLHVFPTYCRQ